MADVDWLKRAGQVGGKAVLLTALAVAYASGTSCREEVATEYYHYDRFGVPPSSGRRCLSAVIPEPPSVYPASDG